MSTGWLKTLAYAAGRVSGLMCVFCRAVAAHPQAHAWLQPQVEGSLPSPRNASVMVKLPSPADKYPAGSSSSSFLLVGGWKPFQHSYDDTFLLTVTA